MFYYRYMSLGSPPAWGLAQANERVTQGGRVY
jgi:hypothetical protein